MNESLIKVRANRQPKSEAEDVTWSYNFQKVSSYTNTESSGVVQNQISEEDCKGKNVLIVEDIYDSGNAMNTMISVSKKMGAASVKSCVLLHKKNPKNLDFKYYPEYLGFFIPDRFIIGYGLDYNEKGRDLRHVCVISQNGIQKYKV